MTDDPYVRVYKSILTDDRFESIYDDDAALATWLRLLIVADGAYPAPAHLPRSIDDSVLERLVDVGLIELLKHGLYVVHGMRSEREKRAEAARFAADAKHHGHAEAVRRQSDRSAGRMRAADNAHASAAQTAETRSLLQAEPNLTKPTQRSAARTATASGMKSMGELLSPTVKALLES